MLAGRVAIQSSVGRRRCSEMLLLLWDFIAIELVVAYSTAEMTAREVRNTRRKRRLRNQCGIAF